MPSDEIEKVARDAAKKMFFGLDPIDCHDDSDTYLVTFETAVKHIAAALSAAHAEPVARDPSRFSRLSQDERPVIRERPDPTLGFISTAEMLASPSEAAIRDEREKEIERLRGLLGDMQPHITRLIYAAQAIDERLLREFEAINKGAEIGSSVTPDEATAIRAKT